MSQAAASMRFELERFYSELSTQMRLIGAEEMGRRYVVVRMARMEANGHLDYSALQRILGRVTDLRSWPGVWSQEAAKWEAAADQASSEGRQASAMDGYLRASACHHWGQYLARFGSAERVEGRSQRVVLYRRAIDCRAERIEPISIPYLGQHLPGYLHLPAISAGSLPACVVMVAGADSTKEEYHNWARQFVRRGLAVLTFDGPGQGELVGVLPMRPEAWHEPMAAVLDALESSGKIDGSRIAAWGSSMGGFLVSCAVARDHRFRAAVSLGGFYDFRDYPFWALTTQLNVMEDLMIDVVAEARDYVAQRCSLSGLASQIRCPYLVIHGARDELVTVAEAKQMAAEAHDGEFVCFPDGFHTCTNYNLELVSLMSDWLAAKLAKVESRHE